MATGRRRMPRKAAAAVAVVIVGGFVALGVPAGAAPSWSTMPAPKIVTSGTTTLAGVSCPSARNCVAVGSLARAGDFAHPVREHWDGSNWSVMSGPGPSDAILAGVACPSATSCFAVGEGRAGGAAWIEHWDGHAWSVMSDASIAGISSARLQGVACANPTSCFAVGAAVTGMTSVAFAEHWDGARWSPVSVPDASDSSATQLSGVSCPSATTCFAVGGSNGTFNEPLFERWNGSTWSIVPGPPATGGQLNSVSCSDPSNCVAVGYDGFSGGMEPRVEQLSERWDGRSWSELPSLTTQDSSLGGVSCTAPDRCTAVGYIGIAGIFVSGSVQSWNGTAWTREPTPDPRNGPTSSLAAVSCVNATDCVAVGGYTSPNQRQHTWAVRSPAGPDRPVVGVAITPTGRGTWLVGSDGSIYTFGNAGPSGSTGAMALNKPIVGMAATPSGRGYRLVASDGGVFSFGDARFFGSTGAMALNKPIVGMAATPSGRGYWLVASDGGVFTFGDARFHGSTGALRLADPVVGMARTKSGAGYWLVASDGGVFTFGDAHFSGSAAGESPDAPVVGIAAAPNGKGYSLASADGGVFKF